MKTISHLRELATKRNGVIQIDLGTGSEGGGGARNITRGLSFECGVRGGGGDLEGSYLYMRTFSSVRSSHTDRVLDRPGSRLQLVR